MGAGGQVSALRCGLMDTTIPVHILNPTSELLTLYTSVILGTLEGVETPVELVSGGVSGEGGGQL